MPWVRSHWRGDRIDSRSRGETEPSHFDEIQIVAKLIEKGVPREQLSTKYQNLWDKAQRWIDDGKPSGDDVPPGARWITEEMYEVDGELHFRDLKDYDRP